MTNTISQMGWPLELASTLYPNKEFYLHYLYRMRWNNGISCANSDRLHPTVNIDHLNSSAKPP